MIYYICKNQSAEILKKKKVKGVRYEKKELLEEMAVAVKDYFVCAVEQEERGLVLDFSSGQKFLFRIEEVN